MTPVCCFLQLSRDLSSDFVTLLSEWVTYNIYMPLGNSFVENVSLVEFIYIFYYLRARWDYRRRFRSLLLSPLIYVPRQSSALLPFVHCIAYWIPSFEYFFGNTRRGDRPHYISKDLELLYCTLQKGTLKKKSSVLTVFCTVGHILAMLRSD